MTTEAQVHGLRGFRNLRISGLVVALLVLLLLPLQAQEESAPDLPPQELPLLEIREVLEDRDQNTVPDKIDETVRIQGVVTVPAGLLSEKYFQAVVQDETGGIILFDYDLSMELPRGSLVEVTGKVNQYRGAAQLIEPRIRMIGSAEIPPPDRVDLTEANEWEYFGELVRLNGVLGAVTVGTFATVPLHKGGEEITLFIPGQVARTFPFGDYPEGSEVVVTGVVSLYKESWPYDDGFQLIVQSRGDVEILELPPPPWLEYLEEGIGIVVGLALLAALLISHQHRRQKERQRELATMNEISSAIGTPSVGTVDLLRKACETITAQKIADAVVIHLLDDARVLSPQCWSEVSSEVASAFEYDMVRRTWDEAMSDDLDRVSTQASQIRRLLRGENLHVQTLVPLHGRSGVVGVITALSRSKAQVSSQKRRMLESTARLVSVGIDNLEMFRRAEEDRQELQQLAITDDLTGLYNRRFLNEYVRIQAPMARRRGGRLGFLVIDLDHFKQVNDTWGHDAGDQVLIRIAEIIQSSTRASDLPVRWGGEEFLVVLSDTSPEGSEIFAERLRKEIASTRLTDIAPEAAIDVTASIGVSLYPDHGDTVEQALRTCDEALYRAKRDGRNKVVTAPGLGA